MSEKQQLEAVRLLQEWLELVTKLPPDRRSPEAAALIAKTEMFFKTDADPEPHGRRRG